jgi:hypothetical protein
VREARPQEAKPHAAAASSELSAAAGDDGMVAGEAGKGIGSERSGQGKSSDAGANRRRLFDEIMRRFSFRSSCRGLAVFIKLARSG